MLLVVIAIFFTLAVITRSYTYVDNNDITKKDLLTAVVPAMAAIIFVVLRESYFALPDGAMVSNEYLSYRRMLLWGFLGLMGYIVRSVIYVCVYVYRRKG